MRTLKVGLIMLLVVGQIGCGSSEKDNDSTSGPTELEVLRAQKGEKTDTGGDSYLPASSSGISRADHDASNGDAVGWYGFAGEKLDIKIRCQGTATFNLYDVDNETLIESKTLSGEYSTSLTATHDGIYALQILTDNSPVKLRYSIKLPEKTDRPRVRTSIQPADMNSFMAFEDIDVRSVNVFRDPVKVGLRGNLKASFSGTSRSVVSLRVPQGATSVIYSLRVSNNENTVASDGSLNNRLAADNKKIKIFGLPVYERSRSFDLGKLLINARPPVEDDAFCSMYVLSNSSAAHKFQDTKSTSDSFSYDISQSQIGTQSRIGEFIPDQKTEIFLGFENQRMRYDTYIWLEAVAIVPQKSISRPVFAV